VYEGIRSPAVHMPKTLGELVSIASRFPNAIFWAGGTYIMGRESIYPTTDSNDIIYVGQIAELKRINRTDKYLVIGSAVTFEQLLTVGKQVIPPILQKTIEQTATKVIRSQITIGGSLCTKGIRFSLSAALAALQAQVEVRTFRKTRSETKWIDIKNIYDKQGTLLLKDNQFIVRVRVGLEKEGFSFFLKSASPLVNTDESVMLAFACNYSQSIITKFNMCLIFPNSLYYIPQEVDLMMQGSMLPLSTQQIERTVRFIIDQILNLSGKVASPIQLERSRRFVEAALHQLNTEALIGL
jgi:xanthine dehydrogenase FAD-binding subunit